MNQNKTKRISKIIITIVLAIILLNTQITIVNSKTQTETEYAIPQPIIEPIIEPIKETTPTNNQVQPSTNTNFEIPKTKNNEKTQIKITNKKGETYSEITITTSEYQITNQKETTDLTAGNIIKKIKPLKIENAKIEIDQLQTEQNTIKQFYITTPIPIKITNTALGTELYICEQNPCMWKKIQDLKPGEEYAYTQNVTTTKYKETGVATINTDKSIYKPNEQVKLTAVVLDKQGKLVENAQIQLKITTPKNQEQPLTNIKQENPGIYAAIYETTSEEGRYYINIKVESQTTNYTMNNYFDIQQKIPYQIIRNIPVTIDPWISDLDATINILTQNQEKYTFTEYLPKELKIKSAPGAKIQNENNQIKLIWENLQQNTIINYITEIPKISPNLILLGPSKITTQTNTYNEIRPWYLAIDPIYFYDPNSTTLQGWTQGTGTTFAEIDDATRQPTTPNTNDYLSQTANTNSPSEFGMPSITQDKIEEIILWVYTGTGNNAQYTFELRQGTTTQCSKLITPSTNTEWQNCTWTAPTGALTDIRIYLGGVTKNGGGQNQNAFVYAAYTEIITGQEPTINLNYPENNSIQNNTIINFNFTATDDKDTTLANCTLYTNQSGIWAPNTTTHSITNATETNITTTLQDGKYIWNIECTDQNGYTNISQNNLTITINNQTPTISDYALNTTLINQSEEVYFNVSITDIFGVSFANISIEHPNGSTIIYELSNSGSEYYFTFTNTNQTGTYTITQIWANDSYNKASTINPALTFDVTPSPPEPFDLISPPNQTISNNQTPTMQWQQTTEPNFKNYTIILDNDQEFTSINYEFTTTDIANTTITTNTLIPDTYYWKITAYDAFENARNSTSTWIYIIDAIPPTITLQNPPNSQYYLTNNIDFNYTPTDTNLKNCTLYTNETGTWTNITTNTTPITETTNTIKKTLEDGTYEWNIQCYDEATNNAFSTTNYTTKIDTTPPTINLITPENNTLENTTNNIIFQYNTTDIMTTIANCKLIIDEQTTDTDTTITETTNQSFTAFVENGQHNWSINCTDQNGYTNTSLTRNLTINVSFEIDPPVISLNYPEPQTYLQTQNITFNYTPSDATGIQNCSIYLDDSLNKTNTTTIINNQPNYITINQITETIHDWKISCYDNNTQIQGNSTTQNFTIDLTNPTIMLNVPENQNITNQTTITFNYTPTDTNIYYCSLLTNKTGIWQTTKTNNTPISSANNYFAETFSDGIYAWGINCTDKAGRTNYTENRTIQIDSDYPQIVNVTQNPQSPTNYSQNQEYQFNATITDDFKDKVWIEQNFSGTLQNITINSTTNTYNYNKTNIKAGNYQYKWYANDSTNKINSTNNYIYIINKSAPELNLYLNNQEQNITINESQQVTKTANISIQQTGNIELYQNGQLINTGITQITNTTNYTQPGTYTITATHIENENYTTETKTLYITVNDITNPNITQISPDNNSTIGTPTITFSYNVTDKTNISNCSLYINNTFDQTDDTITKNITQTFQKTFPDGNYAWLISCMDEYANTANSTTYNFTVKESSVLNITLRTDKTTYQKGQTIQTNTTVTDEFQQPIYQGTTSTYLINANTTKTWWNESWEKRKPIIINETSGQERTQETIDINITGLSITNCYNEIRIINHNQTTPEEIPYQLYDGDNNTWCHIAFKIDLNASQNNQQNYYIYYNNSQATNPNYDTNTDMSYLYYAQTAAQDEPTVTNPGNIAGSDDNTFAQIAVSGGGAIYESASGRAFITNTPSTEIKKVQARYRYEIPTSTANWYLRYSTDDGTTYQNAFLGTTSTSKQTTDWTEITNDYASLTWTEINRTRLQGRVYKPGGGTSVTMNLYWVQLNVTVKGQTYQMQTTIGEEETLTDHNHNETNLNGITSWNINTNTKQPNNYTLITYVQKTGFLNSTGIKYIQITPDTTPPQITITSPENNYNTSNQNITINWTIIDLSGNATCNITLNEQTNQTNIITYNNISKTTTINNTSEGKNNISITCKDTYNNTNTSQTINFTVDITPPTTTQNNPEQDYNSSIQTINFNWTSTDNLLNQINCTLLIDNTPMQNITGTNNTPQNTTITNITYGTHNWSVRCTDQVGNTNTTNNKTFTIITPPSNSNATLNQNGTTTIYWTPSPEADYYNIYITNNYTEGFSTTPNETGITQNNYTDQTADQEEERYYLITSVKGITEVNSSDKLGKNRKPMYQGMNLISMPLLPINIELKNQTNNGLEFQQDQNCLVSIWEYSSNEGFKRTDWINNYFVPATGSEDFTTINTTKSYWLETNTSCNITILGKVPENNISINLLDEYNQVAWYSSKEKTLPTNYDAPIINTQPQNTVKSINRYNAQTQQFEVTIHYMIAGTPWGWWPSANNLEFTTLQPLKGYYIDSNETAIWEHEP